MKIIGKRGSRKTAFPLAFLKSLIANQIIEDKYIWIFLLHLIDNHNGMIHYF